MQGKRQANFELLRIVAMLMIIVLHYLNKSELVLLYTQEHSAVNYTAQLIEAFCIVAVNCYVLLSGYFLVESAWKLERVVSLVAQVLFYSLMIPVVLICVGVVAAGELSVYDWLNYVLPIETEHYWFATAYLIMYLFAPLLAAGVKAVERRTLQMIISVMALYFCVWKSVLPASLATDRYGYDYGWFLFLFLVAAYIRLYDLPKLEKKRNAAILYVGMSLGIFVLTVVSGILAEVLPPFAYYMDMPDTYNHILCLLSSIGMFMLFKDMKSWEGKSAAVIRHLAPYTFGVYLLHEHILVRYRWMHWLGVDTVWGSWKFIPHMIGCVVIVYAAGTVVDWVRAWIFRGVRKLFAHDKAEL
ncbi:MAG: acyltransferase [Lachnospiraceae bacterium]|nr:acyltransferase [Lachnospiraceae bacterium]